MKHKLLVTIDFDEKTCGKCSVCVVLSDTEAACPLFVVKRKDGTHWTRLRIINGTELRCAACHKAEQKAKGK